MDLRTSKIPIAQTLSNIMRSILALAIARAPIFIVVIALSLRFYGINWDQGGLFHPDERALLFHVNDMSWPPLAKLGIILNAQESPLNPRWFPYGSLPMYAVKIVQGISLPIKEMNFNELLFVGRSLSALADVGTVIMVFLLGNQLYNRRVGILASLLLALSVLHIQLSHFYTVDTYLTFFIVTSVYFMARIMEKGKTRDSILAGVFIGLALASKISVAPIFLAFLLVHAIYTSSRPVEKYNLFAQFRFSKSIIKGNLLPGIIAIIVLFFITTPYAFLDWYRPNPCEVPFSFLKFLDNNYFVCDIGAQFNMVRGVSGEPWVQQYTGTTSYWYQIKQLALFGLGAPLGIIAWSSVVFTFCLAISRRNKGDLLILAWVLPYFLLTGYLHVKFMRYLLPMTPFLIIMGSRMILDSHDWVVKNKPNRTILVNSCITILILSTTFYALSYVNIYNQPHTAIRTSEWINENVTMGSVILMEHWEEGIRDVPRHIIGCRGVPQDTMSCMKMYDSDNTPYADGKDKMTIIAKQLSEADYLVFFSNRLYGSIPMVPERYP